MRQRRNLEESAFAAFVLGNSRLKRKEKMYCTKCGTENTEDAKFCKNCGQPMVRMKIPAETNAGNAAGKTRKKKGRTIFLIVSAVIVMISIAVMLLLALADVRKEKRYEENLESGQKFLEEEDYEKAAACFDEAIAIDPKKVEPYRYAAQAYIGMEEFERAEEIYEDAMERITAEYEEKQELLAGSEDIYKEAIVYYGDKGDGEKAQEIAKKICDMTEDEDEKTEVEELMMRYGMYRKYYDLLERYQEDYGEVEKISAEYMYYLKGLCLASLIDFDKDGQEELLLAYADPSTVDPSVRYMLPRYVIEVWRYKDSEIEKVFEGSGFGGDGGTSVLHLTQNEERYYIIEGSEDDFQFNEIWGLEGDRFTVVKEINAESFSDNGPYTIDGNLVSYEEFEAESLRWRENCVLYGFSRGEEEQDRSVEALEETMMQLREKLKTDSRESGEEESGRQDASGVSPQMYRDIYGPILQNTAAEFREYNRYYCYDIDKDGVKELLVQEGTCEADYQYQAYTIHGQKSVYLGVIGGGHSGFLKDENGGRDKYIQRLEVHMGYEMRTRIRITNGRIEEVISSGELGPEDDIYSGAEPIEYVELTDLSLLK